MRSSKSRSRSKQNRPRSIGNIVNRVFDSSGPEGKVRGTPQQIIEKYQALARDAQLSNDRVAAENFLQHAEHYTRMLGEAMRELAAEQEARRQQHGGQGANGNGNGNGHGHGQPQGGQDRPQYQPRRDEREDEQPEVGAGAFAVVVADEAESGLVETPEARAERHPAQEPRRDEPRRDEPQRNERKPSERKPAEKKPEGNRKVAPPAPVADPAAAPAPEASPTPEPAAEAAKPRRSRSPRKPRSTEGSDTAPAQGPSDAAAE